MGQIVSSLDLLQRALLALHSGQEGMVVECDFQQYIDRGGLVRRCAVAQLAVFVVSPAFDAACAGQCTGMNSTNRHLDNTLQGNQGRRLRLESLWCRRRE